MPDNHDKRAAQIEAAQTALRASIEATKLLAEDAEQLIVRRRPSADPIQSLPLSVNRS